MVVERCILCQGTGYDGNPEDGLTPCESCDGRGWHDSSDLAPSIVAITHEVKFSDEEAEELFREEEEMYDAMHSEEERVAEEMARKRVEDVGDDEYDARAELEAERTEE